MVFMIDSLFSLVKRLQKTSILSMHFRIYIALQMYSVEVFYEPEKSLCFSTKSISSLAFINVSQIIGESRGGQGVKTPLEYNKCL